MKITLILPPDKSTKIVTVSQGSTVEDVIRSIHLKPDTIIVLRKNSPIPLDEVVEQGDHLQIMKVASGG